MMPVLVVSKLTISPDWIRPKWGFHRANKIFFRHCVQDALGLMVARFGVCPQVLSGGKSFEFRGNCLIFRVRTGGGLGCKPPEAGSVGKYLLLSVDVKNELFGTSHARARAKVQVLVAECRDRAKSDTMHHVKVLQFRQNV